MFPQVINSAKEIPSALSWNDEIFLGLTKKTEHHRTSNRNCSPGVGRDWIGRVRNRRRGRFRRVPCWTLRSAGSGRRASAAGVRTRRRPPAASTSR